ncbi:hypothetical protein EGR_09409 [Echinococcus granulosus]|uniref:Uncharacterized protein n=1 Tax=Echinococcus granulosus TaxID=6210 RepID=W6U5C0_ECHGR|nr:hypothetical protein EGR_09409 [Echinococcus granulosus]EUB55751.1 hypothetical protein EGR_09409 [Echinococcus granulosus]
MLNPHRVKQLPTSVAKPNTRFLNNTATRPVANGGAVSFEASLRNPTLSLSDKRRGWNSSNRISHQDYECPLPLPQKPVKGGMTDLNERVSKAPSKRKPTYISRSNVEVSAQCLPTNGITVQTMHALKGLVDNFVENLIKGTGQFDAESLEGLNKVFAKITKDQVNKFKVSTLNQRQSDHDPHSQMNLPADTLYQSLLWCLIFQASIDLLSKETTNCSVSGLLQRAWGYTKNLKEFFRPFIKTSANGSNDKVAVELNQNQSNVRDCEVEIEATLRPREPEVVLTDESLAILSPVLLRHRKPHCCRKKHHGTHNRSGHKSSRHHDCHRYRDANVGPSSTPDFSLESICPDPNKVSVKVQTLPENDPLTHLSLQIQQSNLEDQYKSTRIQLANEASKYLSVFRKCQNLQKQMNIYSRTNDCLFKTIQRTPFSLYSDPISRPFGDEGIQRFERIANYPMIERYLVLPVEVSELLVPAERWVPKLSVDELSSEFFTMRSEPVCAIALRTPLISLADIQWYAEQAKRSNSARMDSRFRQVRALPFKRRNAHRAPK